MKQKGLYRDLTTSEELEKMQERYLHNEKVNRQADKLTILEQDRREAANMNRQTLTNVQDEQRRHKMRKLNHIIEDKYSDWFLFFFIRVKKFN